MLEFSIARKYLTPRWRQLSVSIISLISILVIALVVWLIVVFFSVTYGLEKSWIGKLIALTAPVRITPTDAYYKSYYYQVDSISEKADYSAKTIGEKLRAPLTVSYNPESDEEPPALWPKPDKDAKGEVKDLVKLAFGAVDTINDVPGLSATDFEMTIANIRLQLVRQAPSKHAGPLSQYDQSSLQQATYLGSFDQKNPALSKALFPLSMKDLSNIYTLIAIASDTMEENEADILRPASKERVQDQLKSFFDLVHIKELQTPASSWALPKTLWPDNASFVAAAISVKDKLTRIVIPKESRNLSKLLKELAKEGDQALPAKIEFRDKNPYLILSGQKAEPLSHRISIALEGNMPMTASVVQSSIEKALRPNGVYFTLAFDLQGVPIEGTAPYGSLQIHRAEAARSFSEMPAVIPEWFYTLSESNGPSRLMLPSIPLIGDGLLLPRNFRDAGVLVGDRGFLSYMTPTTSSVQEQRIPIFVAGFYDPGIIPIGGKYVLANQEITSLIRSSHNQEDTMLSNGINVRFDNLEQADLVKAKLQKAFQEAGIAPYWRVETYREYDFTKDIIQQLHSEKNLFSLLSMIIIIVACSNIISMLIILVNDKKTEIGILRSMGASSWTIAAIFGWCGIVMGYLGSLIGTLAAIITLRNLKPLIDLLSRLQGYDMFNPIYYGETLPAELSYQALGFVILATAVISSIAGLVPALKASMLRPSVILRSE